MTVKAISLCVVFIMLGHLPQGASATSRDAISNDRIVVVLPARKQTIQLAFELLAIRPRLLLISYQGTATSDTAGMHVWSGREWLRLSDRDYTEGHFLAPGTVFQQMYLVGPENRVPPALQYRPVWAQSMHWIQSLQIGDLVNVFGERLDFTRREWRWIAAQHDLRLFESGVRARRDTPQALLPERAPGEARRPLLERLRRHREASPEPEPSDAPPRLEHQPWREIRVRETPTDRVRKPHADGAMPPAEERMAPDVHATPELEPEATHPPAAEDPAIDTVPDPEIEPEPEPEIAPDPEPEVTIEPEPEPIIEEKGGRRRPRIEERPMGRPEPTAPPEGDDPDALTQREAEFFELLRREFPDLEP